MKYVSLLRTSGEYVLSRVVVGTGRFELPTCRLGGDRSIHLSYVPGSSDYTSRPKGAPPHIRSNSRSTELTVVLPSTPMSNTRAMRQGSVGETGFGGTARNPEIVTSNSPAADSG